MKYEKGTYNAFEVSHYKFKYSHCGRATMLFQLSDIIVYDKGQHIGVKDLTNCSNDANYKRVEAKEDCVTNSQFSVTFYF